VEDLKLDDKKELKHHKSSKSKHKDKRDRDDHKKNGDFEDGEIMEDGELDEPSKKKVRTSTATDDRRRGDGDLSERSLGMGTRICRVLLF